MNRGLKKKTNGNLHRVNALNKNEDRQRLELKDLSKFPSMALKTLKHVIEAISACTVIQCRLKEGVRRSWWSRKWTHEHAFTVHTVFEDARYTPHP